MNINLTPEQEQALFDAARAAELLPHKFVLLAVRALAARYGIEIPDSPAASIKSAQTSKKEGRPRSVATHIMERHVPAGDFLRVCPWCKRDFRVDDDVIVYCSDICEKRASNRRQYARRKSHA